MTDKTSSPPMLGVRMDPELRKRLRIWTLQHDLTVAEVIVALVEILLDDGDELGVRLRERVTSGRI